MASRAGLAQDAVRKKVRGRIALSGPTGAGKTWTALTIAQELNEGKGIVVIDTERESALLYADKFKFRHLPWEPPYDPRELAATIDDLSGKYDVIIVDSGSHFWSKAGGTLDIAGGKFTGWKTARPANEDMVDAMLRANAHVIFCMRSKMDHVQELNEKTGKIEVKKVGMAPVQSDDLPYEFTVAADLDTDHRLEISKTRCSALANQFFPSGHAPRFAKILNEWLATGATSATEPHARRTTSNGNVRDTGEQTASDSSSPEGDVSVRTTLPPGPPASEKDIEALRVETEKIVDADLHKKLVKEWQEEYLGSVRKEAKNPLLAAQVEAGAELIKKYATAQESRWKANLLDAIGAMKSIGVTSEKARHALVREATDGAIESTKQLTPEQLKAIKDYCLNLKKQEGAA